MASKTLHVYRANDGQWTVKKAGLREATFSTREEAVRRARKIARSQREAQVVTHERNGQFVIKDVRGLPIVQKPPRKALSVPPASRKLSRTLCKSGSKPSNPCREGSIKRCLCQLPV